MNWVEGRYSFGDEPIPAESVWPGQHRRNVASPHGVGCRSGWPPWSKGPWLSPRTSRQV